MTAHQQITAKQAERVIAACDRETELRLRLWSPSRFDTATRFADVKLAALGVIDGLEGAEGELLDELEAVDCQPLWNALDEATDSEAKAAESYVPPVGEAA